MNLVKSLLITTLLLFSASHVQAKYAVAKGLAGLSAFLALMSVSDLVFTDYAREKSIAIMGERNYLYMEEPFNSIEADRFEEKAKTFEKRLKTTENVLQSIHNFFGVDAGNLDGGLVQYGLRAGAAALAALGAFGIEYAILNSAN